MKYDLDLIFSLCDGKRSSKEIALLAGCPSKYVQKMMVKHNLPRLKQGSQRGEKNHAFLSGRMIDLDGYAVVSAPVGHPFARYRKGRNAGTILEHRLIAEQKIGRYLLPEETVDHINGIHLHNCPSNLRVFRNNSEHLKETLTGHVPKWSKAGFAKMNTKHHQRANLELVDTYHQRKKRGEIRLQQILKIWLKHDIDDQHLLGTRHHLSASNID